MIKTIFGIDSVSPVQGTAIVVNGVCAYRASAPRRFSKLLLDRRDLLLPMIDETLRGAGIGVEDFDAVALLVGPGSYTGIRVGIATIQGLLFGTAIPVIPVTTFDALAVSYGDGFIPVVRLRKTEWIVRRGDHVLSLGLAAWEKFASENSCVVVGEDDGLAAARPEDSLAEAAAVTGLRAPQDAVAASMLRPYYAGDTYVEK